VTIYVNFQTFIAQLQKQMQKTIISGK